MRIQVLQALSLAPESSLQDRTRIGLGLGLFSAAGRPLAPTVLLCSWQATISKESLNKTEEFCSASLAIGLPGGEDCTFVLRSQSWRLVCASVSCRAFQRHTTQTWLASKQFSKTTRHDKSCRSRLKFKDGIRKTSMRGSTAVRRICQVRTRRIVVIDGMCSIWPRRSVVMLQQCQSAICTPKTKTVKSF